MADDFITEELGDELLVYDTVEHRAYTTPMKMDVRKIQPATVRRQFLKMLVAGGLAAVITAPTIAEACSKPGTLARCRLGDFGKPCNKQDGTCGVCFNRRCL